MLLLQETHIRNASIFAGDRVNRAVDRRDRHWSAKKLRADIVNGFVLADARLKNPGQSFDYFEALSRRLAVGNDFRPFRSRWKLLAGKWISW